MRPESFFKCLVQACTGSVVENPIARYGRFPFDLLRTVIQIFAQLLCTRGVVREIDMYLKEKCATHAPGLAI
jgi:hypothetical protein